MDQVGHDLVRFDRVPGPVHRPAARRELRLEPLQVAVKVGHRVRLDRAACLAQFLPVGQFGDHPGPLAPDGGRGLRQVPPELRVGERAPRSDREWFVAAQVPDPAGGYWGRLRGRPVRRWQRWHAEEGAHRPVLVLARISARWTVLVPVFSLESPPPMCIRQELSLATQASAPVASTLRILSASIAVETSAFLIANVPPNPQHDSRRATRPAQAGHPAQQPERRSPTRSMRSEWQVGW